MKNLFNTFNWKNFLQRTALFFIVFLVIRLLVDLMEKNAPLSEIRGQSLIRYLLFAMIIGLLDSETWLTEKAKEQKKEKPIQFKNFRSALFHYAGVGFFISLLCAAIISIIILLRWVVIFFTGDKKAEIIPPWDKFLLVSAAIGICFAAYEAFRNYLRLKKKADQS
jgi:Mn2+/Fe2+ NRAMP family transporter